jgi:hypothetical protein
MPYDTLYPTVSRVRALPLLPVPKSPLPTPPKLPNHTHISAPLRQNYKLDPLTYMPRSLH